ncbi:MAG: hypothetical protein WA705_18715 [Candidatus Ozemobacteraceae bacterium]
MPFFIPAAAIGAGVSLIVWGSRMFINEDDSADEKAEEILAQIPDRFRAYIDEIYVDYTGIHISFRPGTPKSIKEKIKSNIEPD